MTNPNLATIGNGRAIDRSAIPELLESQFRQAILDAVADGQRVVSFFGVAAPSDESLRLYVVVADDQQSRLRLGTSIIPARRDQFESLTPPCPQIHLFERELAEKLGGKGEGHPWFKPVRYHGSYRPGHEAFNTAAEAGSPLVGVTD